MDVCKYIVPPRPVGTLSSRRTSSPLVRLVERVGRSEVPAHPQGVLPQNCGGNEANSTVSCMVLKVTAKAQASLSPLKRWILWASIWSLPIRRH
ncbi:hypothetical protein TNCV_2342331 [Trichonephila clavipes]|nr:hypothetical protein TNCV_2342331 [Trichonephila clavipes]